MCLYINTNKNITFGIVLSLKLIWIHNIFENIFIYLLNRFTKAIAWI